MTDMSAKSTGGRKPFYLRGTLWLKVVAGLIVFILFFYLEEDWRGRADWKQAQVDIAAAGESLDFKKFIPPPVPDAENFGALPAFQTDFTGDHPRLALSDDLRDLVSRLGYSKEDSVPADSLPYLGRWLKGETPDRPAIEKRLTELCLAAHRGDKIPEYATPAQLLDVLSPLLSELRAANAMRPACRFNLDYDHLDPIKFSLAHITDQIKLAKIWAYHGRLALIGGQPDLALEDFKISMKIDSGLSHLPFLISGLVTLGVMAIELDVIAEGLHDHAWNDAQLAELDSELQTIDRLAMCQFGLRAETAGFYIPAFDYLKSHRSAIFKTTNPFAENLDVEDYVKIGTVWIAPTGWFDSYKAADLHARMLGIVPMLDPATHRVHPEKQSVGDRFMDRYRVGSSWSDFFGDSYGAMHHAVAQFVYQQAQIDMARIAGRLERYRLKHGNYPKLLDDLAEYGDLPRDVMTGEPYHYRLERDGTFILFSVGWNQRPDGAQSGRDMYNQTAVDWLWKNRLVPRTSRRTARSKKIFSRTQDPHPLDHNPCGSLTAICASLRI